jgi:hypothetical protein
MDPRDQKVVRPPCIENSSKLIDVSNYGRLAESPDTGLGPWTGSPSRVTAIEKNLASPGIGSGI